ncbi:hypothetical protein LFYK43_04350 [Ligilactobacillus salitolerans]|uniref:Aminoglycoside phosphotransferase domain-containing protein n=1 Tax=Ligilactobacillus salitolerans TaxID=1808352 RepID=A0A401IR07_9LACO|nr:phosphotransferase [Ligilactobacillus salitolerans]GBG93976.1 hypothetical protein LFYK43_04350 [Ligilactobacillus salitolerans]
MDNVLIDFLNDYYQADLTKIHDVAGNQHLTGYSKYYHTELFVKIFKNEDIFYAEQHVDQKYCPEIFIGTVIFGDNYVVVLKDRQLTDVDQEQLSDERAYIYGRLIAEFHRKVTDQVAVPHDDRPLSEQIKQKMGQVRDEKHRQALQAGLKHVQKDIPAADQEYSKLKKVVLHGDFSTRNIMRYQDKYILLDFEWAHIGCQYEDFIKFFFFEVTDRELRQSFIAGYQSLLEFEIPQKACQQVLLFMSALDIYLFHESHSQDKFGDMADKMLETVISGVPVLEI